MSNFVVGNLPLIEYDVIPITKYKDFVIFEPLNDLTIINQSTNVNIYVNETLLVPGQAYNAGGNYGEINNQPYKVRFVATGIALPTPVPICISLKKRYVDLKKVK